MAGLGVAFVSVYTVRGELETGRLRRVRLRGLDIKRHFHVIHNEARTLTARARVRRRRPAVGPTRHRPARDKRDERWRAS